MRYDAIKRYGTTKRTGTYVGDVDAVLRHVQPDRNVCKVRDGPDGVAVENEALNQTNECERHMDCREYIPASNASFSVGSRERKTTAGTHKMTMEAVVNLLKPSLRFL